MPAVVLTETGPASILKVSSIPVPTPGPNQVLVHNAFIGVNFIDTYFRTGLYKSNLPLTLGREAAGTIAAVHHTVAADSSLNLKEGDRVAYMVDVGAYAKYTLVPADRIIKVPDGIGLDFAAASLLQGLTAWTFIREAGQVVKGQWALVHAAAGGTGGLMVQMLHAVGAKIIATAGSPEKCHLARSYGADWVIDSGDKDVVAEVKEITASKGVHVIFDGVGKATFDSDLEMIARKGTLVVFGNASGAVPPLDILKLGPKNIRLLRPVVNSYVAEREDFVQYAGELFELISSGKVKIKVHEVYNLSDVARAHADLESRKTTGKLLLRCD